MTFHRFCSALICTLSLFSKSAFADPIHVKGNAWFEVRSIEAARASDPFINWTCQGQMDAGTEIDADIWFHSDETSQRDGSYVIRLGMAHFHGDHRQFSELAYFRGVSAEFEDGGMTFKAVSSQDSVHLEISNSAALEQVPGVMSYSVHEGAAMTGLNVICDRNR